MHRSGRTGRLAFRTLSNSPGGVPIPLARLVRQVLGARRVVPLVITDDERTNLRRLLEQDEVWVQRARWVRWLRHGSLDDTHPIAAMSGDSRIAAAAWLHQQQHVLHGTVVGGVRAPDGWVASLPLYRGLLRDV